MIDEIRARDLALIRDASIAPARGMTVVTGETGSGKSALLSAIKLLAGVRADASVVRQGASACIVEGRFYGQDEGGEGTVVARRIASDGRGRVSIDGAMASLKELSSGVGATIDLCGQHEHQRLLRPASHAAILDAWIGEEAASARRGYEQAFDAVEAARGELERIVAASRASAESVDQARFVLARIDEASPEAGEYERLMEDLPRRENAEALANATYAAHEALSGDGGAIDALASAASSLEALSSVDPALAESARSLREAGFILEDVSREMRAYSDGIEFDPEELASAQERAACLQGLMRQYGPRMEDVLARRDEAREAVALAEDSTRVIAAAERALAEAESGLVAAAERLRACRTEAAGEFCSLVGAQMARLDMGAAAVEVSVEPKERGAWSRSGADRVELMFRAGAGMGSRPLAKIASGGEMSRVMLAIKVVLGARDVADTLVFDEVDAGVGGAVARSLADVLADLARTRQVIVVTHLAQVAVMADAHWLVEKRLGEDGFPETMVRAIDGEDRVAEVARMLSGDMSPASLEHAREMLRP